MTVDIISSTKVMWPGWARTNDFWITDYKSAALSTALLGPACGQWVSFKNSNLLFQRSSCDGASLRS